MTPRAGVPSLARGQNVIIIVTISNVTLSCSQYLYNIYFVLLQFSSTIQTPLHNSTPLHSTPRLHSTQPYISRPRLDEERIGRGMPSERDICSFTYNWNSVWIKPFILTSLLFMYEWHRSITQLMIGLYIHWGSRLVNVDHVRRIKITECVLLVEICDSHQVEKDGSPQSPSSRIRHFGTGIGESTPSFHICSYMILYFLLVSFC